MQTMSVILIQVKYMQIILGHVGKCFSFLAFIFHRKNGWTKLANMPDARSYGICGLATNSKGERRIIIANGLYIDGRRVLKFDQHVPCHCQLQYYLPSTPTSHVMSYNLETMEWENDHEPFPFGAFTSGTSLPYGNSFLSVGGYNQREIYKVNHRLK